MFSPTSFTTLAILSLCSTITAQAAWTQLNPTSSPPARRTGFGVSDGARLLMFGGDSSAGDLNDLWAFDGTNWTNLTPAISPPARRQPGLCWDPARSLLVMFGGQGGGVVLNDTWEWDGIVWTQQAPASSPPPRRQHRLAYDLIGGRVLLFGGVAASQLNDTWGWDGTTWTQLAPVNSPSPRSRHAMVLDWYRARILLFGGSSGGAAETWSWTGTDWQLLSPATVPYGGGTLNHGLAFDQLRDRVVLYGGVISGVNQDETWEFDGVDWISRGVSGITGRTAMAIAYIEALQKTYLFAGNAGGGNNYLGDTAEYQTNYPGSFSTSGSGCTSSAGTPTLSATTPWAGGTFDLAITAMSTTALPVLVIGFSTTAWAGGALPFNLGGFGAPNCDLLVSTDSNLFLGNISGTATWSWAIPNTPAAFGLRFYTQGLAAELAGGFALSATNLGDVTVGAL